jgi:hypothetical protein
MAYYVKIKIMLYMGTDKGKNTDNVFHINDLPENRRGK